MKNKRRPKDVHTPSQQRERDCEKIERRCRALGYQQTFDREFYSALSRKQGDGQDARAATSLLPFILPTLQTAQLLFVLLYAMPMPSHLLMQVCQHKVAPGLIKAFFTKEAPVSHCFPPFCV